MDTDDQASRVLDGNVAAGPLAELFAFDPSLATAVCAGCGRAAPLATYTVYADAPALVLRCPGCSAVVLRFASERGVMRADLSGTRLLVVTLTAPEPRPAT